MKTFDLSEALLEKGIETVVDPSDGVVTMLLSEEEFQKKKKYEKIIADLGWKGSWGRRVKRN